MAGDSPLEEIIRGLISFPPAGILPDVFSIASHSTGESTIVKVLDILCTVPEILLILNIQYSDGGPGTV